MHLTSTDQNVVRPRPRILHGFCLLIAKVIQVVAAPIAVILPFHLQQVGDAELVTGATLAVAYLLREAIFESISPPRFGTRGKGFARALCRMMVNVVRCVVRIVQGAVFAALSMAAFSFSVTPSSNAAIAGMIVGFLGISAVQDLEWSTIPIRRASPPTFRGGGYGAVTYVRQIFIRQEIHYMTRKQ